MAINWQQLVNSGSAAPIASQGGAGALPSAAQGPVLQPPSTGNPVATSTGAGSPFGVSPVGGDPNILGRLAELTYSIPGGGYLFNNEAQNANSVYNKFGGSDPMADQLAKSIYAYMGTLPTQANTTKALANLYAQGGATPSLGPSLQERQGGQPWAGPWEILNKTPKGVLSGGTPGW